MQRAAASAMTARKRASDEDRSLTFAAPIRAPNVREGLRKAPNQAVGELVYCAASNDHSLTVVAQ